MTALIPIAFLDLRAQHGRIRDELDAAIDAVIDRGDFVKGSAVRQFESAFADYQAANECVAVANGTDALENLIGSTRLAPQLRDHSAGQHVHRHLGGGEPVGPQGRIRGRERHLHTRPMLS